MVSKTSLLPLVRAFDWKAVASGFEERPSLVAHVDERGRNWLHVCCATVLGNGDARPSICTADVLLAHGIDLNQHAFSEGNWRATPVWFCVAYGRNLKLAEHLLKLDASPQYSLYAAAYNRDAAAVRLLVRYGANIEEASGSGDTPLLGAVGWSHFEAAEAMLACGANVNAQNDLGMTAAHMMLKKTRTINTSRCWRVTKLASTSLTNRV
ncbi:MAG TPA: ankyrin repeat domain-containing protein [Bryobacteraceae bacterium]